MWRAYQSEEDSNTATSSSVDELDDELDDDESDEYSEPVKKEPGTGLDETSNLASRQHWWEQLGPQTRRKTRVDYREKNIDDIPDQPTSPSASPSPSPSPPPQRKPPVRNSRSGCNESVSNKKPKKG